MLQGIRANTIEMNRKLENYRKNRKYNKKMKILKLKNNIKIKNLLDKLNSSRWQRKESTHVKI